MPETYEMLDILLYVKSAVEKFQRDVELPSEFVDFLQSLVKSLDKFDASAKDVAAEFQHWDASNTAREKYIKKTVVKFSGKTMKISSEDMVSMLDKMIAKTKSGIKISIDQAGGISPSYFYYDCVNTVNDTKGVHCLEFKQRTLPLFLEGPVRHMKVETNPEEYMKTYTHVKESGIYDKKLKMYMLSESLQGMRQDLGRMMAFTPGWLENQSVWLHMSYKYYLQLLRAGLYKEFFEEIKTGFVPFMDPEVYGRSVLEASSFIVSSAFPDPKLHGAGFAARLSGSTAEVLSMWAIMFAGPKPFTLDDKGKLKLQFAPKLPGWLFTDEGKVSFTFLGAVTVTYVNPKKEDTWALDPKKCTATSHDGKEYTAEGAFDADVALLIRNMGVKHIVVEL